ncbi:MAG: M42 family metallopeptidase [Ignisphaera sp.]|nr:M42 family metallopeptidase [Ignisphaera sp.]MCX8167719.1 M42 family metallopeptidase [Ignisphaera sp.]MDW8085283.1 M42 family metallopeptidase [Ignisphaera sp.]
MNEIRKEALYALLKKLVEAVGPSGFEDSVRDVVIDELKNYGDSLWIDSLGNVIAVKKGSKGAARLMIAAHMDEIGLIISYIDERGFLRFQPIGGVSERTLLGQRVVVRTLNGNLVKGVIGSKPPHIMRPEEAKQVPEGKDLYIDVGVSSRAEAEKLGVTIGSIAVFERDLTVLGNSDIIVGKALDDRVGVAAMIEAFKAIDFSDVDVYAVATVQEEVGLKGARVAAYSITPHVALALDVTVASDVAGVSEQDWITQLGKGPAIKVADGRAASGLIAHPAVRDKLIEIAKQYGVPYQLEVLHGGTTDASIIALNKEGVPAATISVPTRYIHSPTEVANLNDIVMASKLAMLFATKITSEWALTIIRRNLK